MDQLRWECDSPGTISTRCDETLDTRVYIGLESTLGPLTLARTDKLSMFVVHACLRECQKAPILALYSHFWSFWSKPSGRFGQAVRTK